MVKLLFLLAIFPLNASAIWLEDLFGQPPVGYFSVSYQKLLHWGLERQKIKGQSIQENHVKFMKECVSDAKDWYFHKDHRLQRFAFSLKQNSKTKKISYEFLCAPNNPKVFQNILSAEIRKKFALPITEKILAIRIGETGVVELFSADKLFRLNEAGQSEVIVLQNYQKPNLQTGPLPFSFLVQEFSMKPGGEYFLELKAYLDSMLPEELQTEIKAIHLEFGFIADSLETFSDSAIRVSFP